MRPISLTDYPRNAFAIVSLWITFCAFVASMSAASFESCLVNPPQPAREYRAVWVATVDNIDWPSQKGLSTADQKAELLALLDTAARLQLNTVIFQVRPACDALYASKLEPWSEYISGTMGKAPEPFYDPLAFVVAEAHKRGLELHAWFNPYRAHHASGKSAIASSHVSKTHPELVRQYGRQLWLDPGEKAVQDYSLSVVMDVVRRYDVDGVHFDDYFYPYKEPDGSGNEMDFPDEASWKRFGAGRQLSRDDWRRENVNTFIHRVYDSIKASKPWVKFGVSPFGIWRPGNPAQIRGHDAYGKLYADSRQWLAKGWLDYCAPQLYWGINPPEQSFPVLLKWWSEQNPKGRHLVPGMDTTKTRRQWKPDEILSQIRLTRSQSGVNGHIHWNMRALTRNASLQSELQREVYQQPALVPACSWLSQAAPQKPSLTASGNAKGTELRWTAAPSAARALWLVQTRKGSEWTSVILPAAQTSLALQGSAPSVAAVTAVDRFGNLSEPSAVQPKARGKGAKK